MTICIYVFINTRLHVYVKYVYLLWIRWVRIRGPDAPMPHGLRYLPAA